MPDPPRKDHYSDNTAQRHERVDRWHEEDLARHWRKKGYDPETIDESTTGPHHRESPPAKDNQ